jgi:hypothetical protein
MKLLWQKLEICGYLMGLGPGAPSFREAGSPSSPSSPAKAGDPVNADVSILMNAAEYWMHRFRGA